MSDYQYLIHEYLEGNLSAELQNFLFQEMSANEELRHELLTQIQLQQQAHNDFASINAPDDVKESLFMELGLSEPTHTAPIIAPSSVHTGAESLMGNGIAIVSTLCLGALIGWYVHSLQFTEIKTQNKITAQMKNTPAITAMEVSASPLTAQQTQTKKIKSHSLTTISQQNIPVVPRSLLSENNNLPDEQMITASTETVPILAAQSLYPNNSNNDGYNNHTASVYAPPSIQQLYFEDYSIITRFSTLYPLGNNSFSGQVFQVLYALEDNNSVGLEYSTGTFSSSVSELYDGEIRTAQQTRQFSAYSVAASHHMDYAELLDIIPISTASIGSTISGEPIARVSLGLSWTPEQRVALSFGTDIATIAYRKAGTWQSTSSISLMGSLSVRF